MKRFVSLCLVLAVFAGILQISVYADGDTGVTAPDHSYITIEIEDDVPQELRDRIYAHFYGLEIPGDHPDGIICTLFGHKLSSGSTTVTTHYAFANAPRCLCEEYIISACSRCEYTSQEFLGSYRIYCH